MAKLVRVTGTCEFEFDLVVEVDDDFDPELHEPELDVGYLAAGAVDDGDHVCVEYRTVQVVDGRDVDG
jgi:hypothetical protein